MKFHRFGLAALAGGLVVAAPSAHAETIQIGTYSLHNHPDGSSRPPLYGARLDELYDVTADHDIFTFDFDHSLSSMTLEYTGIAIYIHGKAYGGRDIGSGYANDQYLGVYEFDFVYYNGVGLAPGDDDLLVDLPANLYNYGSLSTPGGDVIALRDGHYDGDTPDFRFGDENNDLGHRGFDGISGWGWIFHGPPGSTYVPNSDWLFTAKIIPAPGAIPFLALGALAARRRRR